MIKCFVYKKGEVYLNIGYACQTVGVLGTDLKTCRKKNASKERLVELIQHNLSSLENMIEFNGKYNIHLFRISSDLIPFGSDLEVNNMNWSEIFSKQFKRIGEKIQKNRIRVSMHPGQYTVLNSPNEDVVKKAIVDLEYHVKVLDSLKVNQENKIVLHIGGTYNNKKEAIERFVDVYNNLSNPIKKRLIIENDDRSYTIEDVLTISEKTGAPVVYDNLHNAINFTDLNKSDAYWISRARKTWNLEDGRPKVHYSQQQSNSRIGSHSRTIRIDEFLIYYNEIKKNDVDIMLEVKDKNLSALKCMLAVKESGKISDLEKEWGRYKYFVLEHSPSIYQNIRAVLKDKSSYPSITFYRLIEQSFEQVPSEKMRLNAADHVWGHLKHNATDKEKETYQKLCTQFLEGNINVNRVKSHLKKLALKYNEQYLIQSLYFEL